MPHMFESPICACESVRLRTLLNFWLWPHNGAHSARQAVDGAAIFSAVSKSTRSAGYTIYPHAQAVWANSRKHRDPPKKDQERSRCQKNRNRNNPPIQATDKQE